MTQRLKPVRVVVALLVAAATPAAAEPGVGEELACGERATLVATLAQRYEETPVARGLAAGGGLVEVFAAARTRTWTILATHPEGRSCIIAVGEHYERRLWPLPGERAGAAEAPPDGAG